MPAFQFRVPIYVEVTAKEQSTRHSSLKKRPKWPWTLLVFVICALLGDLAYVQFVEGDPVATNQNLQPEAGQPQKLRLQHLKNKLCSESLTNAEQQELCNLLWEVEGLVLKDCDSLGAQELKNIIFAKGNGVSIKVSSNVYRLTKHGERTNGVYTVSKEAMKKHVVGGVQGRSMFYPTLDAEEAVLKAAEYADELGLWTGSKAKVQVLNTNIGTLGNGKPTNFINVYRNSKGFIHGSPETKK